MRFRFLLIAVFIAAFAFCFTEANAQSTRGARYNYSHSISANPIGLAFGILNATYEHQVAPINSFTVFFSYWSITDWAAYGFGGSYRWYPRLFDDGKRALEGFSVGPAMEIGFWTWEGPFGDLYDGGTTVAIGGEAGYKWVWDGFALEPILRLSFPVTKVEGLTYGSFGAGVNLGYSW